MQLAQLGLVASRLENDDWVELSEEGDTDLINLVGAGPAVHLTCCPFPSVKISVTRVRSTG